MTVSASISDASETAPRWGMGDAALGWVLALLGGQLSATVVIVLSGHVDDDFDELPLGLIVLAQIGMWAAFLAVPWVAARLKGHGLVTDFGVGIAPWDPIAGGLVGLASQLVLLPLLYAPVIWAGWLDTDELSESARDLTDRATTGLDVTMLVLLVVIAAPITEELFYRGLVLRAIEKRYGVWPGVLGSGALFGLSHVFNNPWGVPGLVVFGIVLGWLVVRTGRLGPAVAAHMVFNTVTVVALLVE